ncbi:Formate dehydrogenase chain D [Roseibacterium elongatum DSM 19469]|uniref:Sulfur carrier protein FdhD n=1 Tax=Roseicyclus elongatus DSM 19469 TaxID=1294273 RepID=W8RWD6_9RHOB|nr:formate dehydrogenase accessory sulfurtransferase FdhD [Roseibacterium elongatum]AHM05489.1 Formate dehydrogenase chain D [Roseibacterium elongatum DSM 19469]
MRATSHSARGLALGPDGAREVARTLAEEVPIAITVNGSTQAVMMATPDDLEDFATGFALTEGLARPDQIERIEVIALDQGIEARLWVPDQIAAALGDRRRAMMGPVGCGLCGIDSLDQALRPLPELGAGVRFGSDEVVAATDLLRAWQPLHDRTHAVHAAGFLHPGQAMAMAREDVGRHNALDKLIGALVRAGMDPARGAIVLTSRVSVEMVQKTVLAGCATLIAVSAPTAHALRLAEGAGLTLAAFARRGAVEIYAHPHRIQRRDTDVA